MIKGVPAKINQTPTLIAEEMVMRLYNGLETGLTPHGFNPLDQAQLFKGRQGPIDRIQGKGRHGLAELAMQTFRGRMFVRGEQGAVDLKALMGYFKAMGPAGCLKMVHEPLIGLHCFLINIYS
jgi:hypothetical protein